MECHPQYECDPHAMSVNYGQTDAITPNGVQLDEKHFNGWL